MTKPTPNLARWLTLLIVIAIGVALTFATFVAGAQDSDRGLVVLSVLATFGTALGTLGLAAYTYRLARVTTQSVSNSEQMAITSALQLAEIVAQRDLLEKQVRNSESATLISERSRIDASAPLVSLQVLLAHVYMVDGDAWEYLPKRVSWPEAELAETRIKVELHFEFINIGRSSASLEFSERSSELRKVKADRFRRVTVLPGEKYIDYLELDFQGPKAWQGELVRFAVTYTGPLFGSIHDRIQWNGWVTPLSLADGVVTANEGSLNASASQVLRSYPALENPQATEEAKLRLLGGS